MYLCCCFYYLYIHCSSVQYISIFFFFIYCVYLSVCNVNNTDFCLSFKKKQSSVWEIYFCFLTAEKHKHASFFNRGNLISNAAASLVKCSENRNIHVKYNFFAYVNVSGIHFHSFAVDERLWCSSSSRPSPPPDWIQEIPGPSSQAPTADTLL